MLKQAGITPGTLHGLRHHAITRVLEQTGDLATAQAFAGHASVATTAIYIHARRIRENLLKVKCVA
jgi:integrase